VRVEVERLSGIVRQLLTLGKSAAQQRDVADLDALCRQALTAVGAEAVRRGTSLQYAVAGETPQAGAAQGSALASQRGCAVGQAMMVDAMRLQQALIQLLRNAVQAAPGGRVVLQLIAQGDDIRIIIDDDGTGVSDDARELLFEPFFTTKAAGEGSGLGLAVAHRIVADHAGRIDVGASPLGGARFTVCLPRQEQTQGSVA
jgi:two-component system, NtrC family, sensor kinase